MIPDSYRDCFQCRLDNIPLASGGGEFQVDDSDSWRHQELVSQASKDIMMMIVKVLVNHESQSQWQFKLYKGLTTKDNGGERSSWWLSRGKSGCPNNLSRFRVSSVPYWINISRDAGRKFWLCFESYHQQNMNLKIIMMYSIPDKSVASGGNSSGLEVDWGWEVLVVEDIGKPVNSVWYVDTSAELGVDASDMDEKIKRQRNGRCQWLGFMSRT